MVDINEQLAIDLTNFFNLDWDNYIFKLEDVKKRKQIVNYNIISVSAYSGHLENYHSDVWKFLLDSESIHGKKNSFLILFIQYLVKNKIIENKHLNDLAVAEILREKGRIDILIVNREARICIIIENKINYAQDQEEQLKRYKEYAENNKWEILAILYISLTGDSLTTIENSEIKITPLAVVSNEETGLLYGWLKNCKNSISYGNEENENIRSFIHQYCMLLQKLSIENLKNMSTKILYDFLNTPQNFKIASFIQEQFENIKLERLSIFNLGMEKNFGKSDYFKPTFSKKTNYSPNTPNYIIFQYFKYNDDTFQLDIELFKDRTKFTLYNPSGKVNADETITIFTKVIGEHEFRPYKIELPNHISYTILMNDEIATLSMLDTATIKFTVTLFDKMNKYLLLK